MIPSRARPIACSVRYDIATLTIAAILGNAHLASAEPAPQGDPVAAEALFKEGRALVEAGDYAAGCPKFEASLALHPSASTMINIAKCDEHSGKLATAWEDYHRAITLNAETRGAERQKQLGALAQAGVTALEPRLPRLRIVVKGAPPGVEVSRDGKAIPASALGEALPADPGPHEVRASAPGYRAEVRSVTLAEGKTESVEIALTAAPAASTSERSSAGGVPAWAWITGAGGIALGGVAAYFLADDLSAIRALRSSCSSVKDNTYCAAGYDYARDNARKNRDFGLALGLGSAGVIAIGAAVVGIVRAPSSKRSPSPEVSAAPWVGPGGAGAAFTGKF